MELDLNDPKLLLREDVLEDPRPFYDTLRREAPVWQIPGQDTYLVSEPALIREAVGRPDDFSSNLVSLLHDDRQGCPVAFQISRYRDPIHVLSTADPPLHTQHRRLLQPHLSPAAVAALEPLVAAIVDEHLTPLLADRRVDFVRTFSDPVPTRTICALIGLPQHDAPRLIELVTNTGALLDGVTDLDGIHRAAGFALELTVYVHEQLQAALERPAADRTGLLAVFAEAISAGVVNADEVRDMLVVLVSAGSETTASLIATAVETLARDSELQERLRRDPERIPDTIEQILRADGPFQFHYRYAPADTTLGDTSIPARSRVLLMWAAANRPSPGTLENPPDSDPRGPAPHYAFGKGMHFCIGAPVARLEARIALEQLLARTTAIALDPDRPPIRRPSIFIRRHRSLPVTLEEA
jgi:cytochrome P450 family 144